MCSGLFLYLRPMRRQSRGFSASISGLSPRVRGHHHLPTQLMITTGTIPAGAGTPRDRCAWDSKLGDYPRGCGDTRIVSSMMARGEGLSPRVRGHRGGTQTTVSQTGTIPAGAGTPRRPAQSPVAPGDYPRGCGDTRSTWSLHATVVGLSPRVRGHLTFSDRSRARHGTIPAGAGTPRPLVGRRARIRDYPRGCGDTRSASCRPRRCAGLSPRVRGHRDLDRAMEAHGRTIPAGAGTPAPAR